MIHPILNQRRAVSRTLLVSLLLLFYATNASASPQSVTYADVVKNPARAKQDAEFKAYLLGVASVVRLDYICPDADRQILSDASRMIDNMVEFSRTPWGGLYLRPTGFGPANIPIPMQAGTALLQIFTEHSRCIRHEQPRSQH